jgi:two-component system chemotaxis response regulator CheY
MSAKLCAQYADMIDKVTTIFVPAGSGNNNSGGSTMPNILIVDDSSTMRKIITRSLRQAGFAIDEIFEAGDGIEGLNALSTNKVDLILSDINMPNMDGLEFVKALRDKGSKVPIVMITTEGGEDIINEAFASGASGSIRKPFTPEQLQEKLGGLL